jgi:hypothetical protein
MLELFGHDHRVGRIGVEQLHVTGELVERRDRMPGQRRVVERQIARDQSGDQFGLHRREELTSHIGRQ